MVSWASGSEKIELCVFFLSLLLWFSSPFAVLLNCLYPNPQVLPFPSDSPPHPTGGEEWENNCMVLCCWLGLNYKKTENFITPGHKCDHWKEAKPCSPLKRWLSSFYGTSSPNSSWLAAAQLQTLVSCAARAACDDSDGADGASCLRLRPPRHNCRALLDRPSFCTEVGQKTLASPTSL